MAKKTLIAIFLICILSTYCLPADDIDDLLTLIDKNAYSVHIIARIIQSNNVSLWDMEVTRLTISGRTISLRLSGDNLLVTADITPIRQKDNSILLVAQGQVKLTPPGEPPAQYSSAIQSLPINEGDKVYFYPLGVSSKAKEPPFSIELEIMVSPYEIVARKEKK